MRRIWTEEENEYLKRNYQTTDVKEIAFILNRSVSSITNQLCQLRISTTGRALKNLKPKARQLGQRYQKVEVCKFPVFHPVMLGIYPVSRYNNGSSNRWRARRAIILKMHDNCCAYCGDEAYTVDHVIPVNKGGTDQPENLVAACGRCNYAFGHKTKHIEMRINYSM
jgi:hypothetical protein